MIEKLKMAGLGYNVSESSTTDKLGKTQIVWDHSIYQTFTMIMLCGMCYEIHSFTGKIPMRHLVYRVQPLPQSLLPLVWDFGSLKSRSNNVEAVYIKQMLVSFVSTISQAFYSIILRYLNAQGLKPMTFYLIV